MSKTAKRIKPHILVVGGEARNMQSKKLKELFEITHVDRSYRTVPAFRNKKFDGVALLPWKHPQMVDKAKDWADKRGLHLVEVPSVGQIGYYMSLRVPSVKTYLEATGVLNGKQVKSEPAAEKKAAPSVDPDNLDEDTIWDSYGEMFVQQMNGLDGEIVDRKTFIDIVKDGTGLTGKNAETLISLLRRQGVITEKDGLVGIGKVEQIDIEKKKEYIRRAKAKSKSPKKAFLNKETPGGIRGEIADAFDEEEEAKEPEEEVNLEELYPSGRDRQGRDLVDDGELVGFFKTLCGRVFENQSILFRELFKVGLRKPDGKPYSLGSMRNYFARARALGIKDKKVEGWKFTLVLPDTEKPAEPAKPSIDIVVDEMAASPAPAAPPPTIVTLEDILSKPGRLYDEICKTYPNNKIPDLAGLEDTARVIRSLFWEGAWSRAAAKTILTRTKLPVIDANISIVLKSRLDFSDDEWSFFALETLRDQPLGSLYTMFSREEGQYRKCFECHDDFYYRFPRRCRDCYERNKRIYSEAKGGA